MARIFGALGERYEAYMAGQAEEPEGFLGVPAVLVAATERVGAGEMWGVFDSDGSSNGPLQIQRFDDPEAWVEGELVDADPLSDDCLAWMMFMAGVNAGSIDHEQTLHALLLANPLEWGAILTWQAAHQLPAESVVVAEPSPPYLWRVTDGHGEQVVEADTIEEAERKARYQVSDVGWGSDPIGVVDRGEAGEIVNISLFPDENFCRSCGRGAPHHQVGCKPALAAVS